MKSKQEIENEMSECDPYLAGEKASPRFGMSYEDGVSDALRWVLGDGDRPTADDGEG